jgi:hypothetical protein
MPTKKKASSRRELIEPTKGDKRYVRRNAKGEFNKVVDVGKSLSSDNMGWHRRTESKMFPFDQIFDFLRYVRALPHTDDRSSQGVFTGPLYGRITVHATQRL